MARTPGIGDVNIGKPSDFLGEAATLFGPSFCQGFDAPLVPRQNNQKFRDRMYQTLARSDPKDAEDFNQKFRPGAVLE